MQLRNRRHRGRRYLSDHDARRRAQDTQLILACKRRERAAFKRLVKRYKGKVFATIYGLGVDRSDAQDLAQEVFIRVWRSIDRLGNPASFSSWLRQIVVHLFYDLLRRRSREVPVVSLDDRIEEDGESGPSRDIPDDSPLPEERVLNEELCDIIGGAIRRLPDHLRTTIVLREVMGLSYEDIASVTAVEMGTVKSRIKRARTRIQTFVTDYLAEGA